jgi:hypothetical protein
MTRPERVPVGAIPGLAAEVVTRSSLETKKGAIRFAPFFNAADAKVLGRR